MFHPLALVEIENRGAIHLFKTFFKVTFVDGNLSAQLLDGNRFADMLKQNLPGFGNFFPVRLICQEFTGEGQLFFFAHHAIQAVKQQHLHLGIDENIFHRAVVLVVQQGLEHGAGPAAERQGFGKGTAMPEPDDIILQGIHIARTHELGKMGGTEYKTHDVDRGGPVFAGAAQIDPATVAFGLVLAAVHISGDTEPEFQVILLVVGGRPVVNQETRVLHLKLGVFPVSLDRIVNGTRNLLLPLVQQFELVQHHRGFPGNGQYVGRVKH